MLIRRSILFCVHGVSIRSSPQRDAPMHTVVGKRIDTGPPRPDPTNEEVAAKLEEFIAEMERIFRTHREKHGYGNTELVVL